MICFNEIVNWVWGSEGSSAGLSHQRSGFNSRHSRNKEGKRLLLIGSIEQFLVRVKTVF